MKTQWIAIFLCSVLLAACAPATPSADTINTAIAQTEAANPTSTQQPTTDTPQPTATFTVTPTATFMPSPTPDMRVIDIEPRRLLLQKSDLPVAGKYFLPNEGWMSPMTNAEIVSSWTVEEGQSYLAETGRIAGWLVAYKRGTSAAVLPDEVYDNVVIYSSSAGAQSVVIKYADRYVAKDSFTEIEIPQIGDISRAFELRETDASGNTRVWLLLNFCYRNVCHVIQTWGWDNEVSTKFSIDLATKLIKTLQELPLSQSVTFSP